MNTYTIKPIEWREQGDVLRALVNNFGIGYIDRSYNMIRVTLYLEPVQIEVIKESLDEAKSFIETSCLNFVEQFLEKI